MTAGFSNAGWRGIPVGPQSTTLGRRRGTPRGTTTSTSPEGTVPSTPQRCPSGRRRRVDVRPYAVVTGPRRAGLAPAKATSARRPTRVRPRQAPPHPARPRLPTSAKTELLQLHSEDFRCWRGCGCFGPRRGDPALRDDQPAHPRHLPAGQNGVEVINDRPLLRRYCGRGTHRWRTSPDACRLVAAAGRQ
jgi:hypothetical protein